MKKLMMRISTVAALAMILVCLGPVPAQAQGTEFYHLDALGSVRVVTDINGNIIERHDYLPYGEECTTAPVRATSKSERASP